MQAQRILLFLSPLLLALTATAGRINGDYRNSELIEASLPVNDTDVTVTVFNVYGPIDVQGHDGDEITVTARNEVWADTAELVATGLAEVDVKVVRHGAQVYVFLDTPYTHFDPVAGELWHSDTCWRRDDCTIKHQRKAYAYRMAIEVQVPQAMSLDVSAINDGDITIQDMHGQRLQVNNINGAIDLSQVSGQTLVNAINQDIHIEYSENPAADSSFESINGDVVITFAGEPNAELVYQTMHGDLYSRFDVSALSPKVTRTSQQKEHGIQYQLDAENRLLVGAGGPEYRFKTLNGDIKIK
ncbi:DUF4097 family beta strand repeat-containing protein [Marinicella meishanensis]|uniref:DUF4097 family beta strand repeat-containing protein n=1 Tax=Marinicella meishanensis TaxID=2873263 RepID=UPI001CBF3FBD|nr:DUF4097 family beta strand repeat-containing protein [Marinicella sp. NBU2979]